MLAFLRKIRKSLIASGNTRKYLLYAIGEVALVVVGILIALQINNWSEYKKERTLEVKILSEIRANLIQDLKDHDENMGFLSHVVNSSKIILEHLNNDLPYNDSLASHFAWLPMAANFDAVSSGYDLWLSEGVNIITNDSLRLRISKLYVKEYKWLRDFLKDRQYNNNQPLFLDMMKKFKSFEQLNKAVPRDFESLKNDIDFKVLVQQNSAIINLTYSFYKEIDKECKLLIRHLETEINKSQKK